jgi:hypothetical protein
MSGVSLKLLTPQLNDVTRESLALHSTSNINVKKLDADAKQLQPLKKRQDASIMGPKNSIPASPLSTTSKNSFRLVQTSKKTQLPRTPNPSIGGMFVRTYSASETRLKSPFKTHGSVPTAGVHMGNSNSIFLNSKAATPIAKNLFSDQAEVTLDDKGSFMVDDKQLQSQDLLEK